MQKVGATGRRDGVWGKRLKEARFALALSQRQLGIQIGLDPSVASTYVNRYELGVHRADYPMSLRLAKVLDVPVAFLYCDSDDVAAMLLAYHRAAQPVRHKAMRILKDQDGFEAD